jgi:metal-responsive CopG/Arc/MetJ family transcriptional regulator
MRTTIEITDDQRAALLSIAASKGLKGFSSLVREALEEYLVNRRNDVERVAAAHGVRGAIDDEEAEELAAACTRIRSNWR